MYPIGPTRRTALTVAGVAAAGTLSACGPNAADGGTSEDGTTSLRMTWWGSEKRIDLTTAALAEYEKVAPDVSVTTEPAEFSSYWDKLATQTAAHDAPDIIQMEEAFLAEYAERGALLDLSEAGLDTSGFSAGLAETGAIGDAGQVGVRGGSNAPVMLVNVSLFEDAGLELPDDASWTWDDFLSLSEQIAGATDDGTYGATQLATNPVVFRLWMRQQGAALWENGALGFDTDIAGRFFDFAGSLLDSPGTPDANIATEDFAAPLEQSLLATGRQGMSVAWSNQAVAIDNVLDGELALMRLPSAPEAPSDHQMWLKPGIFWSVTGSSQAPEAAVDVINFLLNAPEAGLQLGAERGVPPNTEIRAAVKAELDGAELATVEFVEAVTPEVGPDPEISPMGGSIFESLLTRIGESFLFGELDAAAAAQSLVDELSAAVA